ncbi:uncharacterized protein RCO7_09292 [Rhynchosporium graminicola]|uniref:Uncharacterized protein n=1 Tax=Rhynchosporium graminicola TaxID=2792576 RepID=A0A1E1LR27_9HELO|nr:uncharacterized protein RCO7_09292 [Rhynchosporium commune]
MSMSVFNPRFESGSVYASIMKRTVFVPKKGFIKLTLPEAKTGDHVATPTGSQVSFILRTEDDVGRYSFFDEFHTRAVLISEMIKNIEKGIHEMVKVCLMAESWEVSLQPRRFFKFLFTVLFLNK